MGYTGFEVMGVCNRMVCKGGAGWGQQHKLTPCGSVSQMNCRGAHSLVVGTYMGWVNPRLREWGCPMSCRREEVVLVVLTLYMTIPMLFPTHFSTPYPLNTPTSIL